MIGAKWVGEYGRMYLMRYKIVPCLRVGDLEKALEAQYGPEFIQEIHDRHNDICQLMFGECFMNDVCCKYYIDKLEDYKGHSWQDEDHIRLENCIKTFLRNTFHSSDYSSDYVIIDVTQ